ncbi:MAG: hypothetical protein E7310_04135 [Clostridiales bacterium]|nr:hypothetical protein [Clostridiales bacterium]
MEEIKKKNKKLKIINKIVLILCLIIILLGIFNVILFNKIMILIFIIICLALITMSISILKKNIKKKTKGKNIEEIKEKKLKKIAIILFIVIILLGGLDIFLYNEMMPIIDYAMVQSENIEKQMFNSKFTEYTGVQKGTAIKPLLRVVMAVNSSNYNNHIVTIEVKDESLADNNSIANFISKIEIKNKYEVNMYDIDNDEFIDKIFIRTEGEEATEEELKLEQIQQEKDETEYDRWLKEQEEYYKEIEQEEKNKKIAIIVISILAIIGLILTIKGLIILKKGDENKKRKVLIAFITAESIITCGLLLILLGIITGKIYYMF